MEWSTGRKYMIKWIIKWGNAPVKTSEGPWRMGCPPKTSANPVLTLNNTPKPQPNPINIAPYPITP